MRKVWILSIVLITAAVFSPFFSILVMSSIFATLLWPCVESWDRRFGKRALGAILITLGFGVGILIPATGAIFSTVRATQALLSSSQSTVSFPSESDAASSNAAATANFFDEKMRAVWEWMSARLPIDAVNLQDMVSQAAQVVGKKAADLVASMVAGVPVFIFSLVMTLLVLFFLLLDGNRLLRIIRANPWFTRKETDRILSKASGTARFGLLASLVSGAAQALLFSAAGVIAGLSNLFLLATLVFLGSFIPVVGSAPVTIGTTIYQFMHSGGGAGIAFVLVTVVISTVDNFIRPAFLKGSTNIHPLLAMLSALGGLQIFGFCGVFLGPVIVVVTTEVLSFRAEE